MLIIVQHDWLNDSVYDLVGTRVKQLKSLVEYYERFIKSNRPNYIV